MLKKLAIITTHPIQYNAPFFKIIAQSDKITAKIFYTWDKGAGLKHDPGFCKLIEWDIPLLDGYEYSFVKNTSKKPGSDHFWGINNPTLINEILAFEPNAILVYGWNFKSHLKALFYFKSKVPVWFRGDSLLLDEKKGIKTLFRRLFLKSIYSFIDKAFYVGINNKAYFLAHGLKEEQLVYMPHVVDNDFFASDHEIRETQALVWRRNLNIADNDLVVLFAGKLEAKKDPELLLKAVVAINEKCLNFEDQGNNLRPIHLIFVGNGILEFQLQQMAKNKNYIHFLPFQNQSQMPIIYRLGNIFCLPSKGPNETWGLAVNEAMCCKRVLLISDKVGCAADLVNKNFNGYIFKHKNLSHLIECLSLLTNMSKTELSIMGQHSKTIIAKYDIRKCSEIILSQSELL